MIHNYIWCITLPNSKQKSLITIQLRSKYDHPSRTARSTTSTSSSQIWRQMKTPKCLSKRLSTKALNIAVMTPFPIKILSMLKRSRCWKSLIMWTRWFEISIRRLRGLTTYLFARRSIEFNIDVIGHQIEIVNYI